MTRIDGLGYPIIVETGALARLDALAREHAPAHRYAIVSDENVTRHYMTAAHDALTRVVASRAAPDAADRVHAVVIAPGEEHKTREQWAAITDALLQLGCARDTTIVALGGGVIGDLAGFVAATYMRGVPVVQIPTTLLAMVDASVGGKTAVDTPAGKNTVGAFHPPSLVVIDPATLVSLPTRELRAGLAEIIKHGVIADAGELDRVLSLAPLMLARKAPDDDLEALIARSVRIKAKVVATDERERGLRKVLNFGHTIGHGVEAASDYTLLHGEAIAIGMVAEARLAEQLKIAGAGTADAIERVVSAVGLPSRIPDAISAERVLELMQSDKKRRGDMLEYALPLHVGAMAGAQSSWGIPIDDAATLAVLRDVR
ncbi:MAG TPA: 3-dehydroquinate synthase [Gemmatimonadaceae bacterium]|nr:3-dehydroquinate synthase [Gemmatimonadaceae bacterium]